MDKKPGFLNRINQAMADKGILQKDLANKLGMKQPQLSAYLTGKVDMSVTKLEQILEVLEISHDKALAAKETDRPPASDARLTAIRFLAAYATDSQVNTVMLIIKPFLERLNKAQAPPKTG